MRAKIFLVFVLFCSIAPVIVWADEPESARQLRAKLRALDETASVERSQVTVITTSGFSGQQCKDRRVVPVKDVTERYQRLRASVLAAFDGRELLALRDWLDESLPKSAPPEEPQLRVCAKGIPVVGVEAVDNLWNTLRSKTQQIEREPSLVISLSVTSTPVSDAPFSLRPLYSDENLFEDRTDATLSRVYRGVYRISLTFEGFKAVELQKVNLIDSSEDIIQCLLVANNSPGNSKCGLRKKQP
jgi:hypothetical protein